LQDWLRSELEAASAVEFDFSRLLQQQQPLQQCASASVTDDVKEDSTPTPSPAAVARARAQAWRIWNELLQADTRFDSPDVQVGLHSLQSVSHVMMLLMISAFTRRITEMIHSVLSFHFHLSVDLM
jgi:hypothetical protein